MANQPVWERGEQIKKERENEKEREKRGIFSERSSTFSLDFPVIGLANSCEARSKVGLHYKSYAWVPIL